MQAVFRHPPIKFFYGPPAAHPLGRSPPAQAREKANTSTHRSDICQMDALCMPYMPYIRLTPHPLVSIPYFTLKLSPYVVLTLKNFFSTRVAFE